MWGTTAATGAPAMGMLPGQQQPAAVPGMYGVQVPPTMAMPGGMQMPGMTTSSTTAATATAASASGNLKHDIFVGNLAFNTTEEQLYTVFSEVGKVVNVRMVTDPETGKLRGFAFVEFEDPQAALSAIRNMNEYELNGRKLRVNFSNSSHLEALAGKLGIDLSSNPNTLTPGVTNRALLTGSTGVSKTAMLTAAQAAAQAQMAAQVGTQAVADSLKTFSKAEMFDVVAKLKEIADRDPDEARRVLAGHPQLPEAILFLMSKLEMVKTPIPGNPATEVPTTETTTTSTAPATAVANAPQEAASVVTATAARVDPRQRVDPRAAAAARPTTTAVASAPVVPQQPAQPQPVQVVMQPPQQQQQQAQQVSYSMPPPPPPPPAYTPQSMSIQPQDMSGGGGMMYQQQQQQQPPPPPMQMQPQMIVPLDPALIQQVMSLTPQQIQQLPPDKQQSILQLRQQITGGSM